MNTSHVTFPSTDRLQLPGLLYEPLVKTEQAMIWLHGMGDSGVFYSIKRITALAEALTKRGIALLAFNNRGAHNAKILYRDNPDLTKTEQRYQAGTLYELIADCVADIDGAADFMQLHGYTDLYLAGHSTGANKICVYDALATNNPFSRYVLAGPGDDIGLNFMMLGEQRFNKTLQLAQSTVDKGKPYKVMPQYSGMHPFSAQSAADILDPDGYYNSFPYYEAVHGPLGTKTLFKEYSAIKKPLLVIAGSQDEATASAGGAEQAIELLKKRLNPVIKSASSFVLIPGADHSFHGAETEFAENVTSWLCQ